MLTRLTGTLERITGNVAVVGPIAGGLHAEVLLPAYLASRLADADPPALNREVTLHTHLFLESQSQGASFIPRLLGFGSEAEREFFEALTSVKGLGNRRALRALAVDPGQVVDAIVSQDAQRLKDLPEIGKKLAETIILELREKAQKFIGRFGEGPGDGAAVGDGSMVEPHFSTAALEAVSALVALGEPQPAAERMVARALRQRVGLASAEDIIGAAYAARS